MLQGNPIVGNPSARKVFLMADCLAQLLCAKAHEPQRHPSLEPGFGQQESPLGTLPEPGAEKVQALLARATVARLA